MGTVNFLTGLFLLSILTLHTLAQVCLLNRIDRFPCDFRNPDTTDTPNENEYGIYSTRIRDPGPTCQIRRRNHDVRTVDTVGGDPRFMLLFSPGIELGNPQNYGNQMIVFYNISCPAGHSAYFNVADINLEEPNCLDPTTNTNRCVDYVQVSHGEFGITESCGTDPSNGGNSELLTTGNLQVTFRTSDTGRRPGFRATVTCINTSDVNVPQDNNRRKRSTYGQDSFNSEIARRIVHISSIKRHYLRVFRRLSYYYSYLWRNERSSVQFGEKIFYKNFVLFLKNVESREITQKFRHIRVFHIIDSSGDIRTFKRSAKDRRWRLRSFSGPGTLVIVGCHGYFKQFIVDPRGILPLTEQERFVVNELSNAHFSQNLENPDERLCEELVNPPPIDPSIALPPTDVSPRSRPLIIDDDDDDIDTPECPRPNSTEPNTCNFTDDVLQLALDNRNASNALVRTLADVVLTCTEREQPDRLRPLGPLDVDCSLRPMRDDPNVLAVFCSSNREGNTTVEVVSCDVDGEISLDEVCDFPRFTFPLIQCDITPGPHELTMNFIDSTYSTATEVVSFIAPLVVNCTAVINRQSTVANVTCVSNQQRNEPLLVDDCVLDREIFLERCMFPRFQVDLRELRPGVHSLTVSFQNDMQQTTRAMVSFFIPGFI